MNHQIGDLFALQEQRVRLYDEFERAHRLYLQTAPEFSGFAAYRQTVHELTQKFSSISVGVMSVEEKLMEEKKMELARLVRCLQNEEKRKLELTAELHVSKKNAVECGRDLADDETVVRIITSIRDVKSKINEHLKDIRYEAEPILLGE